MRVTISPESVTKGVVRSDLRAAVRRLFAACRANAVEVNVQRRDVEVLLIAVAVAATRSPTPPEASPASFHPAQR